MMKVFTLLALLVGATTSAFSQAGNGIPPFSKLISMDRDTNFSRDSLNMNKRQVFILFDPGCGHCQELGQGLANTLDKIGQAVDIYFVSLQPKELVDGYISMFAPGLGEDPRVHFLFDPEGEFILNFKPQNFPSTYIYAEESGELIGHFDGDGEVAAIVPHLPVKVE